MRSEPGRRPPTLRCGAMPNVEQQPRRQTQSDAFCPVFAGFVAVSPTDPTLRANPFSEVTDPFCRLPLPTLFHRLEAVHLGDLLRISVRTGTKITLVSPRFSRAFQSAPDTAGGAVLYGDLGHPISARSDSRVMAIPYKEKTTLPRALDDVSRFACVTASGPARQASRARCGTALRQGRRGPNIRGRVREYLPDSLSISHFKQGLSLTRSNRRRPTQTAGSQNAKRRAWHTDRLLRQTATAAAPDQPTTHTFVTSGA